MHEQLVQAIRERIKLGISKEEIRSMVLDAGHPDETFNKAYKEATQSVAVPVSTTSTQETIQQTPVQNKPPVMNTVVSGESVQTTGVQEDVSLSEVHEGARTFSKIIRWVLVLTLVAVLAGGVAYGFMTGYIPTVSLFGGAPYEKENILDGLVEGIQKIESSGYKVGLTVESAPRDEDVYPFPKEASEEGGTGEYDFYAQMIPSDFSVFMSAEGEAEVTENSKPNAWSQFTFALDMDDITINADVEFIIASVGKIFVRVNRMPSLFLFDLSEVKGQWMEFVSDDVNSFYDVEDLTDSKEESKLQLLTMWDIARKYNLVYSPNKPKKEEVDGSTAYKYQLSINAETAEAFYVELKSVFEERFPDSDLAAALGELGEEDIQALSNPEYIEYYNYHVPVYVWMNTEGIPVRFSVDARIVTDDEKYESLSDRQVNVTLTLDLTKINMPIEIKIPEDTLTIDELKEKLPIFASLDSAREKGKDAAMKANINNFRASAELFWDDNDGSYPLTIVEFSESTYNTAYDDPSILFASIDSGEGYLICGELSTGEYYCASYTGAVGTVDLNSVGDPTDSLEDMNDAILDEITSVPNDSLGDSSLNNIPSVP